MKTYFILGVIFCFTNISVGETIGDLVGPLLVDLIAGNDTENIPDGVTEQEWQTCRQSVITYAQNLSTAEPWALQMFDASSKIPDGLLSGHFFSPGNWDECLDVRIPEPNPGKGQFCWALISKVKSANITDSNFRDMTVGDLLVEGTHLGIGVCIPSQCKLAQFESALSSALFPQGIQAEVTKCQTDNPKTWTTSQKFGVSFFAIIAALVVTATLLDIAKLHFLEKTDNDESNTLVKVLLCFSIYTNAKKLLHVRKNNPGDIQCLHGMRFITISWIIFGHVYSEPPMYNTSINQVQNAHDWFTVPMMLILNSTMSVDTFFTVSGFLVSYGLLKTLKKADGKFPVVHFYLHRFLRLTPIYAAVVLFSATILPLVGNGPIYHEFYDVMGKPCLDEWWRSLLYIANMWDKTWTCAAHAWYMSNDMQFYVISPLFVVPLYYKPIAGLILLLAGVIGSISANLVMFFNRNLWGALVGQHILEHPEEYYMNFELYYIKPWHRIGPYLIGIFLGYVFFYLDGKQGRNTRRFYMSKALVSLLWMMSTTVCLLALFGIAKYFPLESPHMSLELNAWYTALHRIGWSIGIAWIIFACSHGYGGPVTTFLGWTPFVVLGRLTYSAYLCHLYFIGWFKGTRKSGEHIDFAMQAFTFFGYEVGGHVAGFLFSMCFESSFLRIEKLLMP